MELFSSRTLSFRYSWGLTTISYDTTFEPDWGAVISRATEFSTDGSKAYLSNPFGVGNGNGGQIGHEHVDSFNRCIAGDPNSDGRGLCGRDGKSGIEQYNLLTPFDLDTIERDFDE